MQLNRKLRYVAVFIKPNTAPDEAHDEYMSVLQDDVERWAKQNNITLFFPGLIPDDRNFDPMYQKIDMVITIGGDGTFLGGVRAARGHQIPHDAPFFAVNAGTLGFLTPFAARDLYNQLFYLTAEQDRFKFDKRFYFTVKTKRGSQTHTMHALNDVALNKGALARVSTLELRINGQFACNVRADGLIVSTPTGSTGYNLSAGGPIIHPSMEAIVITPICPHTLTQRPIVVPSDALVDITVVEQNGEVHATFDGQNSLDLRQGETISIKRAPHPITTIKPINLSSFDILREKLHWGKNNGDQR